ncbi:MAG: hypothetical protein HY288_16260 [Planctomycetia bacterium]|nr:hypothetical protein [Planctomycetia bacterium]
MLTMLFSMLLFTCGYFVFKLAGHPDDAGQKRRWPRYSMRTLFVAVTVVAIWSALAFSQATQWQEWRRRHHHESLIDAIIKTLNPPPSID